MSHAIARSGCTLLLAFHVRGDLLAQITLPVEPPIHFAIYDARSLTGPATPQLVLSLQSERAYATLGYRFEATTTTTSRTITVDITRVINDSPWHLPTIGPAWYSTPLHLETGIYQLRIRADSLVDEYRLQLGTQVIDVVGEAGALTIPVRRTYRLPPRAAYVMCSAAGFSGGLCDDFVKLVRARLGAAVDTVLGVPRRNPFRYPLPKRTGADSIPEFVIADLSKRQLSEMLTIARDFTDLFRYAQYKVGVTILLANGSRYSCIDGACKPRK